MTQAEHETMNQWLDQIEPLVARKVSDGIELEAAMLEAHDEMQDAAASMIHEMQNGTARGCAFAEQASRRIWESGRS